MSNANNKLDGLGNPLNLEDEVICLDYGYSPFRTGTFKYFKGIVHEFTPTLVRVRYEGEGSQAGMAKFTKVTPNLLIKVDAIR